MEGKKASRSLVMADNANVGHIKMNPMTAEPTNEPSHQYQPLQINQRNRDSNYQDIAKPKQTQSEYELVEHPVTNVRTQRPNVYQSLKQTRKQKDEICQQTGGAGSDDTKAAYSVKKMKIVLLVTVTVNIVMLLLVIAAAILGVIQIQSKFENVVSNQHLSMSQINELMAATKEDVQDIMDNVSHLTMEIYKNVSLQINNDIGELTALSLTTYL